VVSIILLPSIEDGNHHFPYKWVVWDATIGKMFSVVVIDFSDLN
jgi:hypothetical protein